MLCVNGFQVLDLDLDDMDDIASGNESEEFTMTWQYTNLYD